VEKVHSSDHVVNALGTRLAIDKQPGLSRRDRLYRVKHFLWMKPRKWFAAD
jgi:hypothetical protein